MTGGVLAGRPATEDVAGARSPMGSRRLAKLPGRMITMEGLNENRVPKAWVGREVVVRSLGAEKSRDKQQRKDKGLLGGKDKGGLLNL